MVRSVALALAFALAFAIATLGAVLTRQVEVASSAVTCTISGTPGNDTINGTDGNDVICGLGGDDVINAGPGFDIIDGGTGADDINGGGTRVDRVVYENRTSGVTVTLAGGADDGNAEDDNGFRRDNLIGVEHVYGTPFNDTLVGTDTADVLSGSSGDDTLQGLDQNDLIAGGFGADDINGGGGSDQLTYSGPLGPSNDHNQPVTITPDGAAANDGSSEDDNGIRRDNVASDIENITGGHAGDSITGNSAANVLEGLEGNDTLTGLDGDDKLDAGATGDDSLNGGNGADNLIGGDGNNTLTGGDGNDQLSSLGGNDTLDAGPGADNLDAGAGTDTLIGGDGSNDTLYAGAGDDSLNSGAGDDTLDGGPGADDFVGGGGSDEATYRNASGPVDLTLDGVANDGGTEDDNGSRRDLIADIENLRGSRYNDTLTGDASPNFLNGYLGDDTFDGGHGPDELFGDLGSDSVVYPGRTSGVTITFDLRANDGNSEDDNGDNIREIEHAYGTPFDDTITGSNLNNILSGGSGDDTLDGDSGADDLIGGDGTDTASYSTRLGSVSVIIDGIANDGNSLDIGGFPPRRDNVASDIENITGGQGGDTLNGTTAANVLNGSGGNDTISGSGGHDTLSGGDGGDTIDGGSGTDDLFGGPGSDLATYAGASGPVNLTLDGIANDGGSADDNGARRDLLADIENLTGSAFDDTIKGGASDNVLNGGLGFDILDGGAGADDLNGGYWTDRVIYENRTSGVTVTLAGGADDGNSEDDNGTRRDNLIEVEQAYGTPFNDTLVGSAKRDILSGGSGDDSLEGLGADDTLAGGFGADDISGGAHGAQGDTLTYAAPLGPNNDHFANITLTPDGIANDGSSEDENGSRRDNVSSDIENITGGHGNDSITGTSANNVLEGLYGLDTLIGMDGNDTLKARDGLSDVLLNCDGGASPGTADKAEVNAGDPATTGCETVTTG